MKEMNVLNINNIDYVMVDEQARNSIDELEKEILDNTSSLETNLNGLSNNVNNFRIETNSNIETLNSNFESEKASRESKDNDLQNQINSLSSGSPLIASSVSGMVDTTRVYVNTTDGHWYYHNGSSWVDGGIYQATEDSQTVNELVEDLKKLSITLDPSEKYEGYFQLVGNGVEPNPELQCIKYEIPKGCTKIYIDSWFFAMTGIAFSNVENPQVIGLHRDTNCAMYPDSYFAEMTHYINVIEIAKYYKYVYVPYYKPNGEPIVKAYRDSAINNAIKDANPLEGKNVLIFGDSITYEPVRWRRTFLELTGLNEIGCISYPGAHLCDYNNTTPLDGNYTSTEDNYVHNVVCNQVYYWLTNMPSSVIPDFIIIAASINDYIPNYEELENDINVYTDSNGWINVDNIDRTTFDGAMRWITSKLRAQYPNAKIIFASPIQVAANLSDYHTPEHLLAKERKMERVCNRLSARLLKSTSESGITGEFESPNANGRYLIDGLHPNANGGEVLGTYYANKMISMFNK